MRHPCVTFIMIAYLLLGLSTISIVVGIAAITPRAPFKTADPVFAAAAFTISGALFSALILIAYKLFLKRNI